MASAFAMFVFGDGDDEPKCHDDNDYTKPGTIDTKVQLVISLALGVTAFLSFCMLRPRWKSLYAARKRHLDPSIALPALPDTFLGWVPALYKVTEQQVLVSAGLDAFVFLAFFKMAMKLFAVIFLFAAFVLEPINRHYQSTTNSQASLTSFGQGDDTKPPQKPDRSFNPNMGYVWSCLVFTYFFTALTLFVMDKETARIIRIRQDYLGTQSTITDRTFRLSGIPRDLRTEIKIKALVEKLGIGKVESVTVCRNWKELDDLMDQRRTVLAKLEETWSVYLSQKPLRAAAPPRETRDGAGSASNGDSRERVDEEAVESDRLLRMSSERPFEERPRPQTRFWYGFLRMQSRKTDAIDYYTEQLRLLDEKILAARKKEYEATPIAFVTMDSIAACQMAIQALIDPRPGQLLSKPAPAPSDVVWRNTYASRFSRRLRSWSITIFVGVLSIIWLAPVAFLASALSICTIDAAFPSLGQSLREHEIIRSLVQTGLPTSVVSLLNIAVPYLYDFLSYYQGMLSQGDVALSVISKNFFFTFFNIFLIFTVFGAVTSILDVLREGLKDTTYIAYTLAQKLIDLQVFYANFIMLQGLGLFPFRLLEFGSVSLYPVYRLGAKTPRDFAQMFEPPMFYFGFYLPTALLIFILCLVYSALPGGYLVIGLGVMYFTFGYYTYKYQLLYAMDQPLHATGGAWRIICYRIMLGLFVFQLTMSGYLALRLAYTVALLVVPLLIATVWYSFFYQKYFEPLTRFIALRSINLGEDTSTTAIADDDLGAESSAQEERELLRRGSTIDEDREKGLRFVNPSLVIPLEQPWIYRDPPPPLIESESGDGPEFDVGGSEREYSNLGESRPEASGSTAQRDARTATVSSNSSSSVSLGDTHIWRS